MATHTVVKGDTLSELAIRYNTTVKALAELNEIENVDLIYIGQVLKLDGTPTKTTNNTSTPTIKHFGVQADTEDTIFATWIWSKDHTEKYQVIWYYDTGNSVWFVGEDSTVEYKQSVYDAPPNAKRVKFKVKAISQTRTVNNKETSYWTGSWSTEKTFTINRQVPEDPPPPNVKIEKYKLTADVNNVDVKAGRIHFQVVKDNKTVFKDGYANVKSRYASYSCTVDAGSEYKVRCRAYNGTNKSEWSDYSDNVKTAPAAVSEIIAIEARSETSVYLKWTSVNTAKTYDLEYTAKLEYFDKSDSTTITNGIESTEFTKTGLETGERYFFRVRAVNEEGESAWSSPVSVVIGKKPEPPTTWSSTTTVTVGEPLNFYWVHNAVDGSSQTRARLTLIVDGVDSQYIINNSTSDDEKDKTSCVTVDTNNATLNWYIDGVPQQLKIIGADDFKEGSKIQWEVETAGVTDRFSDPSVQRTVDIYAPPSLELHLKQTLSDSDDNNAEEITNYPFYVTGLAGPNTQVPTSYHVFITANEAYETVDNVGNTKLVSAGDQVYSKYFDTSEALVLEFSANSIDLENNVSYTVIGRVSMNSGLTAESSLEFKVSWKDMEYEPNAELMLDEDTLAMHICPYCEDELEDITLAVYRREFDGTFTEIASGIPNNSNTFVTDPHPALDYARYRIVATYGATGQVSYYDMPGYPIDEHAAIIQWDETWRSFETDNEDTLEQPAWSGSILKIPYNIDVSDRSKIDVALVEYVGRQHPISYYGTQRGATSTWSMKIPKSDTETVYALRRLAIWKGDVYVREPSGTGYWANVTVSFSLKHCEVTIPVTLDITRVEGGV